MTVLLIHMPAEPAAPAVWSLFAEGRLQQSGRGLEAAGGLAAQSVWAVVPGGDVYVAPVELPPKGESKARAIVPFLLEDDLASPVESLHFALSRPREGGPRLAAAVARDRLDSWLSELAAAALTPDILTPDFLALPAGLHADADRVLLSGENGGFAMERDVAPLLIEEPLPTPLGAEDLIRKFHDRLAAGGPVLNLLQGSYAPRRRGTRHFGAWRRPAAVAAVAAAIYLVYLGGSGWWYDRQALALDAAAADLLRDTFPDVTRVVNPAAQMASRLEALRGGTGDRFLVLNRILFESMRPVETLRVRSLRFDERRGELAAEIAYNGYDDLERLKQAVDRQGGVLEEGGSRQSGDGMLGDITLRLPE